MVRGWGSPCAISRFFPPVSRPYFPGARGCVLSTFAPACSDPPSFGLFATRFIPFIGELAARWTNQLKDCVVMSANTATIPAIHHHAEELKIFLMFLKSQWVS